MLNLYSLVLGGHGTLICGNIKKSKSIGDKVVTVVGSTYDTYGLGGLKHGSFGLPIGVSFNYCNRHKPYR